MKAVYSDQITRRINMSIVKITKNNFKEEVLKSNLPVLVEFWATRCGSCREMAPVLEILSEEKKGLIKICTINIDEESVLASVYNVLAVPSMMVIQNGEITSASTGAKSKEELLKMLGC